MFPQLSVSIVNVYYSNKKCKIKKYCLDNIKIYFIKVNELHKINDKELNPNWWIGNEELYTEICKRFYLV